MSGNEITNYFFGDDSGGYNPHGGLELFDRRRLDELFSRGGLLQRFGPASVITVTDSDVPEPATAVLHTGRSRSRATTELKMETTSTTASSTPWSTPSRLIRYRMNWRFSRRRASQQRLRLRLRTHGCAFCVHVVPPFRSRRRRSDRHAPPQARRCVLSGSLTIFLIVDRWRQFVSVLKFVVL